MSDLILPAIGVLALVVLTIAAIVERRRAAGYNYANLPDAIWQLTEYTGAGNSRDWYAPFDGRDLDQHERNHYEQAMLVRAAELLEQRRSGRWQGRGVTVKRTPGLDDQADRYADWIKKHGGAWGVNVVEVHR